MHVVSISCRISSILPDHSLHSILCMCLVITNTAEGRKCHCLVIGHSDSKDWPLRLLFYCILPLFWQRQPYRCNWYSHYYYLGNNVFKSHMCKKLGHFKVFMLHCIQNKVASKKLTAKLMQVDCIVYCKVLHVILAMLQVSPNDDIQLMMQFGSIIMVTI